MYFVLLSIPEKTKTCVVKFLAPQNNPQHTNCFKLNISSYIESNNEILYVEVYEQQHAEYILMMRFDNPGY